MQYDQNLLNNKIESPEDNNYSDDELTFLPFLTFAYGLARSPNPKLQTTFAASLERTWQFVRPLRSAPWNAIYVAAGGLSAAQADIDDVAW